MFVAVTAPEWPCLHTASSVSLLFDGKDSLLSLKLIYLSALGEF